MMTIEIQGGLTDQLLLHIVRVDEIVYWSVSEFAIVLFMLLKSLKKYR